ncbi:hypothetical protein D3C78_1102280 [compost metagenome]
MLDQFLLFLDRGQSITSVFQGMELASYRITHIQDTSSHPTFPIEHLLDTRLTTRQIPVRAVQVQDLQFLLEFLSLRSPSNVIIAQSPQLVGLCHHAVSQTFGVTQSITSRTRHVVEVSDHKREVSITQQSEPFTALRGGHLRELDLTSNQLMNVIVVVKLDLRQFTTDTLSATRIEFFPVFNKRVLTRLGLKVGTDDVDRTLVLPLGFLTATSHVVLRVCR